MMAFGVLAWAGSWDTLEKATFVEMKSSHVQHQDQGLQGP